MMDAILADITTTQVRTLRPGETIPLPVGFAALDPDWTWVVADQGTVVAALLGAPCHGIVMWIRLVAAPGHGAVLPRLLRYAVKDAEARGFKGYVTWLDPTRKEEGKLLSILERGGGTVLEFPQTCVGGKFTDLRGF